ncbi:YggS family pyridoxal phosphate-dependent enzyme [Pelodictyon luteolum]|uniref:Pyridoxal phosphate homeostasis protein n=1 Tax=Chlorobium luteolum (strain DSM 273 / BCRC 81028 / 2530) TaxID=319225 RepID=Q3B5L5_CHLL3|nr:YggS family pyridoxal phosphate-dependent enzyme [Pelodictyon luteolum]ABB23366.1 Protein of unknown function UPF0001 [Pelodictyon luteolum DSM 273]
MEGIASNLLEIRRRVHDAARAAGRDPSAVRLIAVSKTKPAGMIREAFDAGQTLFGESYLQEFLEKCDDAELEGCPLEWHFIGHLQSNKVRSVIGRVSLIHGIDKVSTAEELSKQAVKRGINADYLLEINTSGEATKYGMQPLEAKAAAETLFGLPGITLRGLMTIASPDPSQAETEFRDLRLLLDAIKTQAPHPEELTELSMGMSGDFEAAIRQGATLVRVGTAIFGWR